MIFFANHAHRSLFSLPFLPWLLTPTAVVVVVATVRAALLILYHFHTLHAPFLFSFQEAVAEEEAVTAVPAAIWP